LDNPATQALILGALDGLGFEVSTGSALSSVTATLRGGAGAGPTVLLRADTDALPMEEDNEDPWRSQVAGRAHTCGHDAHVAMLLGAAQLLAEDQGSLAGNVRLMFQPGEEGFGGAEKMVAEGVLDQGLDRPVDAAFAIHVSPSIPSGMAATRPGPLLAATDDFEVTISGAGAHASTPHFGNDPLPVACEIVNALSTYVGRRIDAFDPAVLTVGYLNSGTTTNVIPESARFGGTIRTVSPATRQKVQEAVPRIIEQIAAAHECRAEIDLRPGYPVTRNDPGFVDWSLPIIDAVVGQGLAFQLPNPVMGAEDFTYITDRVPGAMYFLGVCPPGFPNSLEAPGCHSNRMRIDEDALATGTAMHIAIATRYLQDHRDS
jgi:hippurate hydrolase